MVKITNTGFTSTFRMANTPATTTAIKNPSTCAPGKTVAQKKYKVLGKRCKTMGINSTADSDRHGANRR